MLFGECVFNNLRSSLKNRFVFLSPPFTENHSTVFYILCAESVELYNRNKFEMEEPLRPTLTAEDCLINIAEGETVSSLSHIKETLGSFSSQQIVFTGFRTSPFFYVLIEKKKLYFF